MLCPFQFPILISTSLSTPQNAKKCQKPMKILYFLGNPPKFGENLVKLHLDIHLVIIQEKCQKMTKTIENLIFSGKIQKN